MSGTFERLRYDPGAYARSIKQSTDPLLYRLMPLYANNCQPCRPGEIGYIGKVGVSLTHQRPLVDVESDFMGLNVRNTKDPSQKYKPSCMNKHWQTPSRAALLQQGGGKSTSSKAAGTNNCVEGYPCGGGVVAGCEQNQEALYHFPSCHIGTEYTRISNPICTSRGVGVNRFHPLCLQPQDENRWLHPSEVGINYRMVSKDNHVPCVPKLIDPTPLLPKGGALPCPPVKVQCGNYVKPLHPQYVGLNRNWNGLN